MDVSRTKNESSFPELNFAVFLWCVVVVSVREWLLVWCSRARTVLSTVILCSFQEMFETAYVCNHVRLHVVSNVSVCWEFPSSFRNFFFCKKPIYVKTAIDLSEIRKLKLWETLFPLGQAELHRSFFLWKWNLWLFEPCFAYKSLSYKKWVYKMRNYLNFESSKFFKNLPIWGLKIS